MAVIAGVGAAHLRKMKEEKDHDPQMELPDDISEDVSDDEADDGFPSAEEMLTAVERHERQVKKDALQNVLHEMHGAREKREVLKAPPVDKKAARAAEKAAKKEEKMLQKIYKDPFFLATVQNMGGNLDAATRREVALELLAAGMVKVK